MWCLSSVNLSTGNVSWNDTVVGVGGHSRIRVNHISKCVVCPLWPPECRGSVHNVISRLKAGGRLGALLSTSRIHPSRRRIYGFCSYSLHSHRRYVPRTLFRGSQSVAHTTATSIATSTIDSSFPFRYEGRRRHAGLRRALGARVENGQGWRTQRHQTERKRYPVEAQGKGEAGMGMSEGMILICASTLM